MVLRGELLPEGDQILKKRANKTNIPHLKICAEFLGGLLTPGMVRGFV
jgi:hypothetical protein